ncbi:MAG: helix-turn-helix domain-containing protein [Betaproteobacteria bacterium]
MGIRIPGNQKGMAMGKAATADTTATATGSAGGHLDQNQLAQRWGVSVTTLERWRSLGLGCPYLKLGGQCRYRLDDVLAFERDCLRQSTSQRVTPARADEQRGEREDSTARGRRS